ncbi:FGGY family carbohydrate kinase [Propionivibrio soli]|uniref:FGGY family carbohydrate kinase n=1 Tax=Propionivibrio soli TaxID=2976531 RepID=UPI0021E78DDF|nr:FGGY family carbohydrate kinase [Propionivibrio soli]
MPNAARTVLGLDASTQSLSAILLDSATGEILWNRSLAYRDDPRLLGFGFEHDTMVIPPREPGEAEQPPRLFIAALDAIFSDMKAAGVDTSTIAAINTSGQQHGHVYLSVKARTTFASLREPGSAESSLLDVIGDSFAYGGAPIWKTANTTAEASHIRAGVGGKAAIIERTGSDIPLRFAATVHRKVALRYPIAYAETCHIVQISSLVPAILAGDCTIPIDFGNACGTGIMNYRERAWDEVVLKAVAGDLPGGPAMLKWKLPPIAHPLATVGTLAAYFQRKYGLPADCRIIAGSGDNPQSKVLASGDLLSLGTSFVYMISSPDGGVDAAGTANAMYDGLGRPFNFGCRTNGALAWDRLRLRHGLGAKDYAACDASLANTPAGSRIRFWHPDAESFPVVGANSEPVRVDDGPADFVNDFSAVVDSSLGLVYRYGMKIAGAGANVGREAVSVCGGPSTSPGIMRRIAAIWSRPAIQAGQAGAALGAAVAAAVALVPETAPAERDALAEKLRGAIFAGKAVIEPDAALVQAYHAPGGYLDRLETEFEKLRKVS